MLFMKHSAYMWAVTSMLCSLNIVVNPSLMFTAIGMSLLTALATAVAVLSSPRNNFRMSGIITGADLLVICVAWIHLLWLTPAVAILGLAMMHRELRTRPVWNWQTKQEIRTK